MNVPEPLVWNADAHREITEAFHWLQMERSTKAVILTGTGEEYCAQLDAPSFARKPWDEIWREGRRMLNGLNDVDVPFAEDLSHSMGVEGSGHWVDGGIRK